MKKISKKTVWLLLVVLVAGSVTVLATGDDPVISLSYLNEIFMPKVENKIKETAVFTVVNVGKGKTFVAKEGCELILRGGKGSVIASKSGGISDTTEGVDLADQTPLPPNHLLIVPRDDGRGFLAETDVILMVKGGYEIK